MMTEAWETDGRSPVQIRRRACLAGGDDHASPAVVLFVARPVETTAMQRELAGQPFDLHPVHDTAEALLVVGRTCPDAVVLAATDGRLSPGEFLDVLHALEPDLRIIVGVGGDDDGGLAARAVALGATVTARPFAPEALLGLIGAALGNARVVTARPLPIEVGRLRIDSVAPRIWLDDTSIRLPLREHLVLRYLAARPDAVISRHELVAAIWGEQSTGSDNSLSVHVTRLRRRLAAARSEVRIEAVRGLGYQLTATPNS
ncbi:winged helix-turn-helix domain-containing protein [Pseudonocardia tropica]|jgi:DNA-binding response OmpR family regulator|uniref:Winged helix-turn-helix domain-containing protein n=1 Tax=Pseudonocardia tropica TaxID=681289 RepID=A0ABV1K2D5_9PSEU|nr:winged helix-turn-helix domain-containing protein [Pseudonocardia alni]WFG47357.1 response regulator transcription factor [Pseudonocardia alni]